jgi:parallel beta-helix repeat protein
VSRRRNSLSKIRLLLTVFLLSLSIYCSPGPIRLSTSLVSTNKSISQSYIIHDPIAITTDGELAAVANSGTGTANDPYIIAGWNITGLSTHGISIIGTTKYFKIENCWVGSSNIDYGIYVDSVASGTTTIINNTCNSNYYGISLWYANSSTVINNTCTSNRFAGINLEHSGSSTVAKNTCTYNSRDGIRLRDSNYLIVTNNTCTSNRYAGINLEHSGSSTVAKNTCTSNRYAGINLEHSGSSTVVNNTCNNNYYGVGIGLWGSAFTTLANNTCNSNYYGIRLGDSNYLIVTNNTCNSNGEDGIHLGGSDNNSIVWNIMVGNGAYGIELSDDSANNIIHHNDFIANGQDTSQACDNGMNNQWYDDTGLEGNYWSDYNGTGSYLIDGTAGARDPYPSLSPYRYTSETAFPKDILVRIGLFLAVIGLVVVVFFVNRRKISS